MLRPIFRLIIHYAAKLFTARCEKVVCLKHCNTTPSISTRELVHTLFTLQDCVPSMWINIERGNRRQGVIQNKSNGMKKRLIDWGLRQQKEKSLVNQRSYALSDF